jgi:putative nucleotidyltransferase-like protein
MSKSKRSNGFGGVLPVGRLNHLMLAALGRGDSVAEWRRYLDLLGTNAADEGERRLYPLAAQHLPEGALSREELAPLRAQGRAAFVRREILFVSAGDIDDLLNRAGVRAALLKGLALQIRVYGERTMRASSDIDLYVAVSDLEACLKAVAAAGWMRTEARPRTGDAAIIASTQTRLTFQMPSGTQVDIHWCPRQSLEFDRQLVDQFTDDLNERSYRGRSWRIPSDLWLLFETIEHGMAWNEVTPIRWLADAVQLLDRDDVDLDWDRLCHLVERTHLNLSFATALSVMRRYTDRVPQVAIDRLAATRPGLLERLYTRCRLMPPPAPFYGLLLSGSHLLLRAPGGWSQRIARWPGYYRSSALKCLSWPDVGKRAVEKLSGAA